MAISQTHKDAIEKIATNLLKTAKAGSETPINVENVAKSIDLKVEYFPFPNEVSGLLKKDIGVIGINDNQHPKRQRFTLAHEIGHYVLEHKIMNTDDLVDDSNTDTSSPIEREANYFASCLLMPRELVEQNIKGTREIDELARKFNVSEQAMTIRVLELGLF